MVRDQQVRRPEKAPEVQPGQAGNVRVLQGGDGLDLPKEPLSAKYR